MLSSPILDYLIQLKNAYQAGKKSITLPYSNFKSEVSALLKKHGYISEYSESTEDKKKFLTVKLSYQDRQPSLTGVRIVSRPGRRIYERADTLPWGKTPSALILISTSAGIKSQKEAKKLNIGGEVIAEIY